MDGPTLIIVLALIAALTAVSQAILHLINPEIRGLRIIAVAYAVGALGLYALGLRTSFPIIVLGNWAIFVCYALLLAGLRRLAGLRAHVVPLLLLTAFGGLPTMLFDDLVAGADARVVIHSAMIAGFSVPIAWTFTRIPGVVPRINAVVFGANVLIYGFRAIWTHTHPSTDEYLLGGVMTRVVMLWSVFLLFELATGFTLMVSEFLRAELRRQANVDPLTGVLNRRGFDLVASKMAEARDAGPTSLMMIDIDHFKRINDTYGHAAGDRVLAHVARVMGLSLRGEDILARFGGEEFVALLPGCGAEAAERIAQRLRRELAEHPAHPTATVSVGVATDPDGVPLQELIRRADAALYRAKSEGRDRYVVAGIPYQPAEA